MLRTGVLDVTLGDSFSTSTSVQVSNSNKVVVTSFLLPGSSFWVVMKASV